MSNSALPQGPGSGGSRVAGRPRSPAGYCSAIGKLKDAVVQKTSRNRRAINAPWREFTQAAPDLSGVARPEDDHRAIYGNNWLIKDAGIIGTISAS